MSEKISDSSVQLEHGWLDIEPHISHIVNLQFASDETESDLLNVQALFNTSSKLLRLKTCRDIQAGQELFFSFIASTESSHEYELENEQFNEIEEENEMDGHFEEESEEELDDNNSKGMMLGLKRKPQADHKETEASLMNKKLRKIFNPESSQGFLVKDGHVGNSVTKKTSNHNNANSSGSESEYRSFACPSCGKTFASSSGLKQHMHIHGSIKPYKCEICSKAYTQFSNLCRHKRSHSDCKAQYACKSCRVTFQSSLALAKHEPICASAVTMATKSNQMQSNTAQQQPGHITSKPNERLRGNNSDQQRPSASPTLSFVSTSSSTNSSKHTESAKALLNHQKKTNQSSSQQQAQKQNQPAQQQNLQFNNNLLDLNSFLLRSQQQQQNQKQETNPSNQQMNSFLNLIKAASQLNQNPSQQQTNPFLNPALQFATLLSNPLIANCLNAAQMPMNEAFTINSKDNNNNQQTAETTESTEPMNLSNKRYNNNKPIPAEPDLEAPLDLSNRSKPCTDNNNKNKNKAQNGDMELPHQLKQIFDTSLQLNERKLKPQMNKTSQQNQISPGSLSTNSSTSTSPSSSNSSYSSLSSYSQYDPLKSNTPSLSNKHNQHRSTKSMAKNNQNTEQESDNYSQIPASNEQALATFSQKLASSSSGNSKDKHVCKFCDKSFPRSANLTRHLRTHTGEQPYSCRYCERSFSISSNLQRHIRNIHNREKPFKCVKCQRCFGQQTNLDRHMRKHDHGDLSMTALGASGGNFQVGNHGNRKHLIKSYKKSQKNDLKKFGIPVDLFNKDGSSQNGKSLSTGSSENLGRSLEDEDESVDYEDEEEEDEEELEEEDENLEAFNDLNENSREDLKLEEAEESFGEDGMYSDHNQQTVLS